MPHVQHRHHEKPMLKDASAPPRAGVDDAVRSGIQRGIHLALGEVEDLRGLLGRLPAGDEHNREARSLLMEAHEESVRILLLLREIAALLGPPRTTAAPKKQSGTAQPRDSERLLRAVTSEFSRGGGARQAASAAAPATPA